MTRTFFLADESTSNTQGIEWDWLMMQYNWASSE